MLKMIYTDQAHTLGTMDQAVALLGVGLFLAIVGLAGFYLAQKNG